MIENQNGAEQNMKALADNPYPGRGIVMGVSSEDQFVQIYWVMGRSPNSRNRILVNRDGVVRTEALDLSKVEDPSLIIYNAMSHTVDGEIVSNGDQTDTVANSLRRGDNFRLALSNTSHEPDAPNYTPRITGLIRPSKASFEFSKIVRRKEAIGPLPANARFFYEYNVIDPGYGYCLHTYSGDGNPLPSFDRDPYLVRLEGTGDKIAETYWNLLNPSNRVALAVKTFRPWEFTGLKVINAFA